MPPAPGHENYYAALAGGRDEVGGEPTDAPSSGEDAVPLGSRSDTNVTAPTPPEPSRAQAALVSDERVVDAFAANAKAELHQQKNRRKNHWHREDSWRSAG